MAGKSNPHPHPANHPPSTCIISGKVHGTEKMHLLDKVLSVVGKTLCVTLLFSMLSQIISAKPSMESPQNMNSESIMEKADLISIQIIR